MALSVPDGFPHVSGVGWGLSDLDGAWLGASASQERAETVQHQATLTGVSFPCGSHVPETRGLASHILLLVITELQPSKRKYGRPPEADTHFQIVG